jgi:hypothetical protein
MRRILAITLSTLVLATAAAAQGATKTIIVSSGDGYGTTTCLAEGGHCGRVIADAMCNSEGYPRARSFGPAKPSDITAAISASTQSEQAFIVECGS